MEVNKAVGLVGSSLLFLGVFLPIFNVPIVGNISYFQNGNGQGALIIVLALLSTMFIVWEKYKGLWYTGFGIIAALVLTFCSFEIKLSDLKTQIKADLSGNPFAEIANIAMQSTQPQWGWTVLLLGAGLLIYSAVTLGNKNKETSFSPSTLLSNYFRFLNQKFTKGSNIYKVVFVVVAILSTVIFCNHISWHPYETKILARLGVASEQRKLGVMYWNGENVPQSYEQSAIWERKAAEQGDAKAQYNLAQFYRRGKGLTQDYNLAREWYIKSAEQGNIDAQKNLGTLYSIGEGVPQDDSKAIYWWSKAADQGDPEAEIKLGGMYFSGGPGPGTEKDDKKAAIWIRKAAEQGNIEAQFILGSMYALGRGVEKDNLIAHMWLNLAASAGNSQAATFRNKIAFLMTTDQIREAQKLAADWREHRVFK
jgi:TPR repeat protein